MLKKIKATSKIKNIKHKKIIKFPTFGSNMPKPILIAVLIAIL